MKKVLLTSVSLLFFMFAASAQTEPEFELTDHPMVNGISETNNHYVLELKNGKKVKFNNLYPVDFYASDNENVIIFVIHQGRNKTKEGFIRMRDDETAVMVEHKKGKKGKPNVLRGQRLVNRNAQSASSKAN